MNVEAPTVPIKEVAVAFAEQFGVQVIPVVGKEVEGPHHWLYTYNNPHTAKWDTATGFGVICGTNGWRCIDADNCKPERIKEIITTILTALELSAEYPWKVATDTGFHLWFRTPTPDDAETPSVMDWKPWGTMEGAFERIELRQANCYALMPPSLHPSGKPYAFMGVPPTSPPAEVEWIALTNALCKVSYHDSGRCGGCYQPEECCRCWERDEEEEEDGYYD